MKASYNHKNKIDFANENINESISKRDRERERERERENYEKNKIEFCSFSNYFLMKEGERERIMKKIRSSLVNKFLANYYLMKKKFSNASQL